MKRLNNHGDTIVEVLIAIIVVSSVLVGAFVSAQHSSIATRRSQERVEALKSAESQLELLRQAARKASDPAQIFDTAPGVTNDFCLDMTGARKTAGDVSCATVAAPGAAFYSNTITRNLSTNTFVVKTTWERAGGGGNDTLTLAYRAYQ